MAEQICTRRHDPVCTPVNLYAIEDCETVVKDPDGGKSHGHILTEHGSGLALPDGIYLFLVLWHNSNLGSLYGYDQKFLSSNNDADPAVILRAEVIWSLDTLQLPATEVKAKNNGQHCLGPLTNFPANFLFNVITGINQIANNYQHTQKLPRCSIDITHVLLRLLWPVIVLVVQLTQLAHPLHPISPLAIQQVVTQNMAEMRQDGVFIAQLPGKKGVVRLLVRV